MVLPQSHGFQEVDMLDKLLPVLDLAGYAYSYATGIDKPHGCLIAYKTTMFRSIHETKIEYDKLEVKSNPELSTQARIGSSHQTRNIASIVALQAIDPEQEVQGYIIATTHLFWHPAFVHDCLLNNSTDPSSSLGMPTKEQGNLNPSFSALMYGIGHRQAGLLVREVIAFQELRQLRDWPCIIAGGQNFRESLYPQLPFNPNIGQTSIFLQMIPHTPYWSANHYLLNNRNASKFREWCMSP